MNIELYEQKINMLYDYLTNEDFQKNYEVGNIDINKINLTDIELPEGEKSDEILQYILKQNLQYLFTINDDIYFKVLSNNISTIIKISFSNKLALNDNLISYLLSELVLKKNTNNILLPIVNINVNLLDLKTILKSIYNLPLIYENYFEKNKKKIICLKVRECFYNLTTLRNYIETEKANEKNNSQAFKKDASKSNDSLGIIPSTDSLICLEPFHISNTLFSPVIFNITLYRCNPLDNCIECIGPLLRPPLGYLRIPSRPGTLFVHIPSCLSPSGKNISPSSKSKFLQ
jgi:hypothetical protein